jgi:hypothetical protein
MLTADGVKKEQLTVVKNPQMMKVREKPIKLRTAHEMKQLMKLKAVMKQRT